MRTYNLTCGRKLLFACRHRLGTASNFVAHMSKADTSRTPCAAASWDQGTYAMTLSAFAWNIARTYTLTPGRRYFFGCRYRPASNLVMYVSAADNDYVGVTGTFLGTPSQGVWSTARLDFSVPPGGIASCRWWATWSGVSRCPWTSRTARHHVRHKPLLLGRLRAVQQEPQPAASAAHSPKGDS